MTSRASSLPAAGVSVLLGLGSNLGEREKQIQHALELLEKKPGVRILRRSSLVETEPVGGPPQGRYLNGVLEVETTLEPRALLETLAGVEQALGRERTVRNGPREIDLDILLYGDLVVDEPDLQIPHPRMLERGFVLDPLKEIAPGRIHPLTKRPCLDHWGAFHGLRITRTARETAELCARYRGAALSLGLVPTMGALHAGHLSLIQRAREECERVMVSIFVNPTQFGPGEDFKAYPRTLESDLDLCLGAGASLVFVGSEDDLYPAGAQTWVTVEELSKPLCGVSRPTHFRGVATVVAKLFGVVRPHRAYFGQKDYQQALVIQRLAKDLEMDTDVRVCATVREPDGLAMSSRNVYLDPKGRETAPRIYRALLRARDLVLGGEKQAGAIVEKVREVLQPGPDLSVEYIEVRDAQALAPFPEGKVRRAPGGVLLAVAVRVGGTRLIDNIVIQPGD
jgi:pantoate--beta-alanine ligase